MHIGIQVRGSSIGSARPSLCGDGQGLGLAKQTLVNWVRQAAKGKLAGAGAKPVSAEQMELARVKMERDILKKVALSSTSRCNTNLIECCYRMSSIWRKEVDRTASVRCSSSKTGLRHS